MSDQPASPTAATLLAEFEPALPFVTVRSRIALDHLQSAYADGQPLAVLNSGWTSGANHLIRRFLASVDTNVVMARPSAGCSTDLDGMREIVQTIGFDPKDMGVANLEKVFQDFLFFQRKNRRRTIIVLEETNATTTWVRDRAKRFVELESVGKFGLVVILSRKTDFNELASEEPLDELCMKLGKHISLTPFTLSETRKYIRWRIDADESADIGNIIDFQATTLIHEVCEGMPDAIDAIACASLELADDEDTAPVSTSIVLRAGKLIGMKSLDRQPGNNSSLLDNDDAFPPPTLPVEPARIILSQNGQIIRQFKMETARLTIGRSPKCDICIESPFVSRKHAALYRNGDTTSILDMSSKNGTYVNSQPIRDQVMEHGDEISIGFHRLKFLNPSARHKVKRVGKAPVKLNGPQRLPTLYPAKGIRTAVSAATASPARKPAAKPE